MCNKMEDKNYEAIIEAILFTMGESVEIEKIAAAVELDKKEVKKILDSMIEKYEAEQRGLQIMELDGAYQMCTRSEMYEYLIKAAKTSCLDRCFVRNIVDYSLQAADYQSGNREDSWCIL